MSLKTAVQKGCLVLVLVLVASVIPRSSVCASWVGEFTLTSENYSVEESAGIAYISVRLTGEGTAQKPSITFSTADGSAIAGSDYSEITGSKKFPKARVWAFRVPILADALVEGEETFTVSISDPTEGATLGTPSTATVTIVDDDVAGITVTPTTNLSVTEGGGTATFSVVLNSQPAGDVTINLYSSDTTEGTVSPASLTFIPGEWNIPQIVTVTGVDDVLDDGNILFTIVTDPASSIDLDYDGIDPSDVSVTNIDNDTVGVTIIPSSGLSVSESGGSETFTAVLNTPPSADVTFTLESSDLTEGTVSHASLTFTPSNWGIPQTVTITGVDDDVDDGDVTFTILTGDTTSLDPVYNGRVVSDVTVTNSNDDTARVVVNPISGLVVGENGTTDGFTIVLGSQPLSDVSIALSSSDPGEGTVSPGALTFTADDWDVPQPVSVTGVDDVDQDGNVLFTILTANASSYDPLYDDMPVNDVSVTNLDDDSAGVLVDPNTNLSVTEDGSTAQFMIVLTSQPAGDVTIGLSSLDTSEGTVSPASLTFTTGNWYLAQTVTITGVNDSLVDGNVLFSVVVDPASVSDPTYDGLESITLTVTNIDDDAQDVTVIPITGLLVTEQGEGDTFSVVLNAQPTHDVVIDLSSSDLSEGTVIPASLTFTSSDWHTAQIVTVTGVNDFVDDGDVAFTILTSAVTSDDPDYDGLDVSNVSVTNADDDTAWIVVKPVSGLIVNETGGSDTFTVVLASQPLAGVSIDLSSLDLSEGTVSPATLNFTPGNWSVPQEVTVTGVDDPDLDGGMPFTIQIDPAVSTDPAYSGMDAEDVSVTNLDDDSPNTAPEAIPDGYFARWQVPLVVILDDGVLDNDTDADVDPLTAELVDAPAVEQGTLDFHEDGSFTFYAAPGFHGDATFTYRAFDGLAYSGTVTVTIHVGVPFFIPILIFP